MELHLSNVKTPLAEMLFEIAPQPIKHAYVFKTNSQFPLEIKLKALAIFLYHHTISSLPAEDTFIFLSKFPLLSFRARIFSLSNDL